ncbi:glycosyltransferase family 25 protein [Glaciecola sp. XM2]|uniref:glycosyltransferase family 25 protein n=1 Tax=Glaciecola sp. XM2 TaxID=1914931 RepID=UPI001BDE0A30|nr:glycosyltransferase family 25 protein [Glaciecola sp. XM2]MBT1451903.1 glycosyltransferase family 25 protein [Glaciecola sp. XM2]
MLPIFVINLDGSDERLRNVEQQLQSIGATFERIPAVDGRIMSEEERLAHYSPKKNEVQYHKALTPGEIGCYLSHRKAWQSIIDKGLDAAIILEDDIVCQSDLTDVQTFIESGFVFDYVKLSDHPNRPRKSSAVKMYGKSELVTFDKVPVRACAQIVSATGAANLLKNTEKFGRPVDIDLQYWWEMEISVHGIKPFPFAPAPDVASDINAVQSRSGVKSHRLRRIRQQISFKLNNALRSPKL